MNRTLLASALAAATLFAPLAAHAQTTYNGNGGTGFGGGLGNGSLTISSTPDGSVTFSLAASGGSLNGNDAVVYIDSVTGGFANTSTFSDNGDGGRTAISGLSGNGRTLATFAPGFGADYALSIEDGFLGVFDLSTVTSTGSFNYLFGAGQTTEPDVITLTPAQAASIGITPGGGFKFVATLISTTAFRSNETIGTSVTVPGNPTSDTTNAGFTGSTTFTSFDTFGTPAAAPEPSGTLSLIVGALTLGGLALARRRTVVS